MKCNHEVRETAKRMGVRHWEIAAFLGISEPTIMRWLRVPLTPEKEEAVLNAINSISKGGKENA